MAILAIFFASSPMRSRSRMVLVTAITMRRSVAAGWRRAMRVVQSSSISISRASMASSRLITVSASWLSASSRARTASATWFSTRPPISSMRVLICSSSSLKEREMCWSRCSLSMAVSSAETAGDIGFGELVLGVGEHLFSIVHLDQLAQVEIGGAPGNPRRLLHGVGDDGDGVVLGQLGDQLLDARGGDGIEGRAGLVHEDHLGADGDGAGDAQALLLAAGKAGAGLVEAILDLVPEAGALEAVLDDFVEVALAVGEAVEARPVGDVLEDRLGEGIGLLKHHAHPGAQRHHVHPAGVDVLVVEDEGARHPADVDGVVHAVQGAQEGGFATARGADHGDHLVLADVDADVEDRLLVAVENIHVAH